MTALPVAWLTLLAALQGSDDYDDLLARLEDLAAAHPLGHHRRPRARPDPVGQGPYGPPGPGTAPARSTTSPASGFPCSPGWPPPSGIEAAVRAGETAHARAWTDELAEFAEATGRAMGAVPPWPSVARSTADQVEAEAFFQARWRSTTGAGRPLDAARAELAYGEWLRRSQRRVDARQHLRQALETFQDVRAEAPGRRGPSQELRASGETARKRDPSTLVQLTPTELQIAQLVSSGMSNKDVAAQCWISPRTVAFHLRNVFAKAGVTSRGELAQLDLA